MSEIIEWGGASVPALPPAIPNRAAINCMKLLVAPQSMVNADANMSDPAATHLRG